MLEQVQLRVEAFEYLQLPFAIKEGCVGRLKLQVRRHLLLWQHKQLAADRRNPELPDRCQTMSSSGGVWIRPHSPCLIPPCACCLLLPLTHECMPDPMGQVAWWALGG